MGGGGGGDIGMRGLGEWMKVGDLEERQRCAIAH